jgi:HEAT repeat protein
MKALGSIGDPQALRLLTRALEDSDGNVRQIAASALGNMKSDAAVEPLIRALRDDNAWVVSNAEDSLKKLTGQNHHGYDAWRNWYRSR